LSINPEDLWLKAVAGDADARRDLMKIASSYALATLSKSGEGKDIVSDLVQNTLTTILRALKSGKKVRCFHGFVHNAARGVLSDFRKKRRRHGKRLEPLDEGAPSNSPTPAEQAQKQDLLAAIARCRDSLPEDIRTVIDLQHTQGMSIADVARKLGLPRHIITYRIASALRHMEKCLEAHGYREDFEL
jgi:RNA polymerase sigma factor (sigma-70 family)